MTQSQDIIVVSGLPRSGTSMMMRMIAAAGVEPLTDGVREADPDNPHGYFEFEPVKRTREDPSWVDAAPGRVVKMVHLLLKDLPPGRGYRVVFMQRDLDEVLASQERMLERRGRPGAKLAREALRRTFESQVVGVLGWLSAHPEFSTLEVQYRDVVERPRECADRVAAFLGLPAGAAERMAAAVDPSLYRNRR